MLCLCWKLDKNVSFHLHNLSNKIELWQGFKGIVMVNYFSGKYFGLMSSAEESNPMMIDAVGRALGIQPVCFF